MGISQKRLSDNLQRVADNIAAAAGRVRRDPANVRLVAVTKSADLDDVKALIELGVVDIGESRVQQLTARAEQIGQWLARRRKAGPAEVRWHMVGHLQRNKVRHVLPWASTIHSVDSLRLAEEIANRAAQAQRSVDALLQVNCSEEPQKFGVAVGAAAHLAEQVCTLKTLRLIGLMTMGPLVSDPEKARPAFVRLREIFEEMRNEKIGGRDFCHLSMGMTQDYQVAVEEGATILRIGTALFE
jgi:pyridoxal phosphate enzyme (YggS family)